MNAKTQTIRLLDVFVIGPSMIGLAVASSDAPLWLRWTVGAFGVSTIFYNAGNYLKIAKNP